MPWTTSRYPDSLKGFTATVRHKAIEIANTLVEEAGHEDAKALAIATTSAKEWARNRGLQIRANGEEVEVKAPAIHVVPDGERWALRRETETDPIQAFDERREARSRALRIAARDNTDMVLHRADGTIADRVSRRRLHDDDARYHVLPSDDGWDVRREGAEQAHRHCGTKKAALAAGREVARNQHGSLVIHLADGRVQREHSYSARPTRN